MTIQEQTTQTRRRPPGRTIESRENQLVCAAVDLAEKQIRDGTASSQVITHFLKLGSPNERLNRELITEEIKLRRAKTKQIESGAQMEEIYNNAIKAMRTYSGADNDNEEDETEFD